MDVSEKAIDDWRASDQKQPFDTKSLQQIRVDVFHIYRELFLIFYVVISLEIL